jgi:hypothetical protein
MAYIYADVDKLENTDLVGNGQCVVLVQAFAKVPESKRWTEGDEVLDNPSITKGTAIATFVKGKYPNQDHDNHAALFISHGAGGFWVMDQWKKKLKVSKRFIRVKGDIGSDGTYPDAANNAKAFAVID